MRTTFWIFGRHRASCAPTALHALAVSILISISTASSYNEQSKEYIVCNRRDSARCVYREYTEEKVSPSLYSRNEFICGLSRSKPAVGKFLELQSLDEPNLVKWTIKCKSLKSQNLQLIHGSNRERRQTMYTPRGRYRGQTQSQYLAVDRGNEQNEGKAEALSSADTSRASVSGKSGMGQAQSQTIYDPTCDECYRTVDSGAASLERKPWPTQVNTGQNYGTNSYKPNGLTVPVGNNFSPNQMNGAPNHDKFNPDLGGGNYEPNSRGNSVTNPTQNGNSIASSIPGHSVAFGPNHGSGSTLHPTQSGGFIPIQGGNNAGVFPTQNVGNFIPSSGGSNGYIPSHGGGTDVRPSQNGVGIYSNPHGNGGLIPSTGGNGVFSPNQNVAGIVPIYENGKGTGQFQGNIGLPTQEGVDKGFIPGQIVGPFNGGIGNTRPNQNANGGFITAPGGRNGFAPNQDGVYNTNPTIGIHDGVNVTPIKNGFYKPNQVEKVIGYPSQMGNNMFGPNQGGNTRLVPTQGTGIGFQGGDTRHIPGSGLGSPQMIVNNYRPSGNAGVIPSPPQTGITTDFRPNQPPISNNIDENNAFTQWPFITRGGSTYFCCAVPPNMLGQVPNSQWSNAGENRGYGQNPGNIQSVPNLNKIGGSQIGVDGGFRPNQENLQAVHGGYGLNERGTPGVNGVFGPNQGSVQGVNGGVVPYQVGTPGISGDYNPNQGSIQGVNGGYGPNLGGAGINGGYVPNQFGNQGGGVSGYGPNQGGMPGGVNGNYGPSQGEIQGVNGDYGPNKGGTYGTYDGNTKNQIGGQENNIGGYGPNQEGIQGNYRPNQGSSGYGQNQNGNQDEQTGRYGANQDGIQGTLVGTNRPNSIGTQGGEISSNGLNQDGTHGGQLGNYGPSQTGTQGGQGNVFGSHQTGSQGGYEPGQFYRPIQGGTQSENGGYQPNQVGTQGGMNSGYSPQQTSQGGNNGFNHHNGQVGGMNGVGTSTGTVPNGTYLGSGGVYGFGGGPMDNVGGHGPIQGVSINNEGGIPENVLNPNSITTNHNDDSDAIASVSQNANGTTASASSKGGNEMGHAQTQVSGTYSGSGSFTAQAQISDEFKGADSQVSGNKQGASSNAQGRGRNNKSQANVQLGSETGSIQTQAQSDGAMHSSNSQVQGSVKGGMADAQARGPGSTSSQAQIGFTPYKDSDKSHELLKTPFVGAGTASAQSSGRTGQSQSQLQGKFKYGISYNGAAQAGASIDKDAVFANRLSYDKIDVFDKNNININVDTLTVPNGTLGTTPLPSFTTISSDEALKNSESGYSSHSHSDHHKTESKPQGPQLSSVSTPASRRSFQSSVGTNTADYEYTTDKEDNLPDEYDSDSGFGPEATDTDQGEYANYVDIPREPEATHLSVSKGNRKKLEIQQTTGGNTQNIVLNSLNNHDAEIVQQTSEPHPDENRIYQAGETVPGTGGYNIPIGFTGSVKSVASREHTYAIGSKDSPSQAQTISLKPGNGKIKYTYPVTNRFNTNVNPKDLRSLKSKSDENNRYVSVTKSVTGDLDGDNNIRKQYSHTYYTKSSSCGYFTFSCTIVSGPNGRKKVCKPKIPTNPDGTPMRC